MSLADLFLQNHEAFLLWSHGFFCALALKRGRIKTILDRFMPAETQ